MTNIYVKATKQNLKKLLELKCSLGVDTEIGLLSGEFIAVNKFGIFFYFK